MDRLVMADRGPEKPKPPHLLRANLESRARTGPGQPLSRTVPAKQAQLSTGGQEGGRKPPIMRPAATAAATQAESYNLPETGREALGRRRAPANTAHGAKESDAAPAVLIVGSSGPGTDDVMLAGLDAALTRHGMFVESVSSQAAIDAALVAAPDLIVLLGEAASDSGRSMLEKLGRSAQTSVIPVVIIDDNTALDARLRAFRYGAAAVIPRSHSIDAIAERVARLAREVPDRGVGAKEILGEATLEEFMNALERELCTGILSVSGSNGSVPQPVRLLLGGGKPLADFVDDFVARVTRHFVSAEPLNYEFDERPGGTLGFIAGSSPDARRESIRGLRLLLADDDAARADRVAQDLRLHGATVKVTDFGPSQATLERLRQLDPAVLLIGHRQLNSGGYELVRRMRRDLRLRWASLLVLKWEDLWEADSDNDSFVARVSGTLASLVEPEQALLQRASSDQGFDTRLETTGPARLLRALQNCPHTLRVTVRNARLLVHVDVAEGLLVGATAQVLGETKRELSGHVALSALLMLSSGRVRVERVQSALNANVMATIEMALDLAQREPPPIEPSIPAPARASEPASSLRRPENGFEPKPSRAGSSKEPMLNTAKTSVAVQSGSRPGFESSSLAAPAVIVPRMARVPSELSVAPSVRRRLTGWQAAAFVGLGLMQVGAALGVGGWVLSALRGTEPRVARDTSKEAGVGALPQTKPAEVIATPEATPARAARGAITEAKAVQAPEATAPKPRRDQTLEPTGSLDSAGNSHPIENPDPGAAPSGKLLPNTFNANPPSDHALADKELASGYMEFRTPTRPPLCDTLVGSQPFPADAKAAQEEVKQGQRLLVKGDAEGAQAAFCRAARLDETNGKTKLSLAQLLVLRGGGAEAREAALKVLELGVEPVRARIVLGDALFNSRDLEGAKLAWLEAKRVLPGDALGVERVVQRFDAEGEEALRNKDYLRAERVFSRALVLAPSNAQARLGLATAYLYLGENRLALNWSETAARLAPEDAKALVIAGDALVRLGEPEAARQRWEQALQRNASSVEAKARLRRAAR